MLSPLTWPAAEVALLSYDSPEPCEMSLEGSIRLPSSRVLALPIDVRQPRSAGAYIITREACERMVKCLLPIRVGLTPGGPSTEKAISTGCDVSRPSQFSRMPSSHQRSGLIRLGNGFKGPPGRQLVRRKIPLVHQATQLQDGNAFTVNGVGQSS